MKEPVILNNADVAPEILCDAIVEVAAAAKKLLTTPLKNETLYLLIQNTIKVKAHRPTLQQIELILTNASRLDKFLLKDPVPPKK